MQVHAYEKAKIYICYKGFKLLFIVNLGKIAIITWSLSSDKNLCSKTHFKYFNNYTTFMVFTLTWITWYRYIIDHSKIMISLCSCLQNIFTIICSVHFDNKVIIKIICLGSIKHE